MSGSETMAPRSANRCAGATYQPGFHSPSNVVQRHEEGLLRSVVLITDALSYSATTFSRRRSGHEVGCVLGTSGNTERGGAKFVAGRSARAQRRIQVSVRNYEGAEMIVAMRRSICVGLGAGSPENSASRPTSSTLTGANPGRQLRSDGTAARIIRRGRR